MSENHLWETEMARLSDGERDAGAAEHLRWCARCRSVVADYRWLQRQIVSTLEAAVGAVPAPRPRWWIVQERLAAVQRQQIAGRRVSAASVAATVCLMLLLSSVLGTTVVAQVVSPEAVVTPAPVIAAVSVEGSAPVATLTPALGGEEVGLMPTPVFMPVPTPPEPGM
jgi:hypothetical protein